MQFQFISSDPAVLNGKPCIKNTRISIELILEWMANGSSISEIIYEFPQLNAVAIKEAILYATIVK